MGNRKWKASGKDWLRGFFVGRQALRCRLLKPSILEFYCTARSQSAIVNNAVAASAAIART